MEVAVVIVRRLDVAGLTNVWTPTDEDVDKAAEKFARALHDRFGVGDRKCHTGALLFVAMDDRATYLSTGRSLKFLSDRRAGTVLDSMGPLLRKGDLGGAVIHGLDNIIRYADQGPPSLGERFLDALPTIIFFSFFFMIAGAILAAIIDQRKTSRDLTTVRRHLSNVEHLRDGGRPDDICSICLDTLFVPTSPTKRRLQVDGADVDSSDNDDDDNSTTLLKAKKKKASPVPSSPREVETIVNCGHSFHQDCLQKWFDARGTSELSCPICRQNIDPGASAVTSAVTSRYAVTGGATGGSVASIDPVVRFRLDRIHSRFPRHVTRAHLSSWQARSYTGPLAHDPANPLVRPTPHPSSSSSSIHRGRSSVSFSGGRSFGGAGRRF